MTCYFFYWLGLSIGMHAFPSTEDLGNIWRLAATAVRRRSVLALLSYPIIVVLYVLNFARVLWADLLYGIAVGILLPLAIFRPL